MQGGAIGGDELFHFDGFFDQLLDRNLDAFFDRNLDGLFHDFFNRHFDADLDDLLDRHFHAYFLGSDVGGKSLTGAHTGHVGGQATVTKDGKETADRDGDAAQE